jgi:hypothetical protein
MAALSNSAVKNLILSASARDPLCRLSFALKSAMSPRLLQVLSFSRLVQTIILCIIPKDIVKADKKGPITLWLLKPVLHM